MKNSMILVTGATGFIGKHLLSQLHNSGDGPIRALSRKEQPSLSQNNPIEYMLGDISDPNSLESFVEPDATLINLAHANTASVQDAIETTRKLVEKCAECGIKRFIHCSSISVYGRVKGLVDEKTMCAPHGEYGAVKYAIEQTLLAYAPRHFELVILRPTEVFGEGGLGLTALTSSLISQNSAVNYIRSSVYGKRRMHLVPVNTVVDTIQFFVNDPRKYDEDIFIISADENPANNFRTVEQLILAQLEHPDYPLPPLPFPKVFLNSLLMASGRATVDSEVLYSSQKLRDSGFVNRHGLEDEIKRFVNNFNKAEAKRMTD